MIRAEDLQGRMDRKEAAEFLGISTITLDRLIHTEQIEIFRIGGRGRGRIYMTQRALLDYVNRQRQPAKPEPKHKSA